MSSSASRSWNETSNLVGLLGLSRTHRYSARVSTIMMTAAYNATTKDIKTATAPSCILSARQSTTLQGLEGLKSPGGIDKVGRRTCLDGTGGTGVTGGVPDLRSSGSGDVQTFAITGLVTGGWRNVTLGTTSAGLAGLPSFFCLHMDNALLQHPMIELCPRST